MSGDTFGCPSWRGERPGGRSQPTRHRAALTRRTRPAPSVHGSEAEKLSPRPMGWSPTSPWTVTQAGPPGRQLRPHGRPPPTATEQSHALPQRDAETAVAPAGPQGARPAPGLRWAGLDVRLPFFSANAAGLALSWRPPQRVNRACPWNRGLEMSGRLHICLPE